MNKDISSLRKDYRKKQMDVASFAENPLKQFRSWFEEAVEEQVLEVNAMVLGTVGKDGRPSARVVLLKGLEEDAMLFYTNYESDKAVQMEQHPYVSLTFFWPELERQVRVEGKVVKTSAEQSDKYFNSRPRDSRIGAWVSPQSQSIASRATLEERLKTFEEKFEGKEVSRPEHWGGYAVFPDKIEFWQGGANRLHDRLCYEKVENTWKKGRLAP